MCKSNLINLRLRIKDYKDWCKKLLNKKKIYSKSFKDKLMTKKMNFKAILKYYKRNKNKEYFFSLNLRTLKNN